MYWSLPVGLLDHLTRARAGRLWQARSSLTSGAVIPHLLQCRHRAGASAQHGKLATARQSAPSWFRPVPSPEPDQPPRSNHYPDDCRACCARHRSAGRLRRCGSRPGRRPGDRLPDVLGLALIQDGLMTTTAPMLRFPNHDEHPAIPLFKIPPDYSTSGASGSLSGLDVQQF